MNITKVIPFGKIDGYGHGVRNCAYEVEINVRDWNGYPEVAITGSVWNHIRTDIIAGGQCIDDEWIVRQIRLKKRYNEVLDFWKRNHLKKIETLSQEDKDWLNSIFEERVA